nr:MAG TPA: hypothetical protein [Caudoviricetes sp.]
MSHSTDTPRKAICLYTGIISMLLLQTVRAVASATRQAKVMQPSTVTRITHGITVNRRRRSYECRKG